ncbi:MAG: IPT/TIG domain-containing protein [Pyrinomonadaceae bacterium]|nr:IPT/TIG domain-containing protein [Pyrinomonadaceae bacterium]
MSAKSLRPLIFVFAVLSAIVVYSSWRASQAQSEAEQSFRPDVRRALRAERKHSSATTAQRKGGYTPTRIEVAREPRPDRTLNNNGATRERAPARPRTTAKSRDENSSASLALPRIRTGTSLARVLHTSQLSIASSSGTNEQYADQNRNFVADERTTFDQRGGSFDIAVSASGARYEVFSATDDRGTSTTSDDRRIGVLVTAFDTNADFMRDSSNTFDLERDFRLPSAAAAVAGTSRQGREFVIVSSSGYYNSSNPNDPNNEPSAGVVLLVRDQFTGGFDVSRSRPLVAVGDNQLNNANALALLPSGDLLIADFDSYELRIVRDTNADNIPDTLDAVPYYSYRYSTDAPLDIAANSRGVVFSHSYGDDAVLLALYDENADGRADREEVAAEGLSLDNNLFLHGLTVDREGMVYVIEDASGAADLASSGGNLGTPRIDAFPDPALNGFLRDGSTYAEADYPAAQALSGLAFGADASLGTVNPLASTNSASLRGAATRDGLATITGTNLTRGATGGSTSEAAARGLRVTVEGRSATVLSFSDSQINFHVPDTVSVGLRSIVVSVGGDATAAADAPIAEANPGLFTVNQTGAGEAVALIASGNRFTASPFPQTIDGQPSVVSLFGTGWRNSPPVTVRIGNQIATVQYAGATNDLPGLDQINVTLPSNTSGTLPVVVTTANGVTSRADVSLAIR